MSRPRSQSQSQSRSSSPTRPPSALRARPPPFTPSRATPVPEARPPSVMRSQTPLSRPLSSSKISAPLTVGVKPAKKAPALRRAVEQNPSRPITPSSPRRDSPAVYTPEQITTVTSDDVDLSNLSISLDDDLFREDEDKVLVNVRVRPNKEGESQDIAWNVREKDNKIQLKPECARAGGAGTGEYCFDNVLTGSDNKSVYNATARAHVRAAMEGYNSVVFAYGQTASGKTFTLTGDEEEPGIIPRAMKDVFGYIRKHPKREFLLRASYLEIYNETIHDLLSSTPTAPVQLKGSTLVPLREEIFTSPQGVTEILERGEGNRRTASTDWNERSSRSHSIFRLVIESREYTVEASPNPSMPPPTPGGSRLFTTGGKAVQMSVLSLIDLAGSEKATSDKERTREGRYINTSLLTLGTVIQVLGENSSKGKTDHVPFRNSKLTHLLQASLSGDARISVICTVNASAAAITETQSTLGFAARIKKVQLKAAKKEMIDTEALIERYKAEIQSLKRQLEEREREAPALHRRLSLREACQKDESKTKSDMNKRLNQLKGLILRSDNVDTAEDGEPRPVSPNKVDFDMSPYQLRQELFAANRKLEMQSNQILSLEAALEKRPLLAADATEDEKDKLIAELSHTVRELSLVTKGYETHLGEPLRAVREDVEKEFAGKLETLEALVREKDAYALECARALDKEKQVRAKLEEKNMAMTAFLSEVEALYDRPVESRISQPRLSGLARLAPLDANRAIDRRKGSVNMDEVKASPVLKHIRGQPSLLEQMPEEIEGGWDGDDDLETCAGADARFSAGRAGEKENVIA